MAAAAAGSIAYGVTEILKRLSSVVANEITLVSDFKDELKNLQTTLNMIMAVMEDAEKKQLSSKDVRLWMEDLKKIAYDAEDILDEYINEVILFKHQNDEEYKSTVFNKVRNVFSSSNLSFATSWKLAGKVKKINESFNQIATRINYLDLQKILGSSSHHELMMMNIETTSFIREDWKIVGRENDKSNIIKMLLEEEKNTGGKHVSVIPIVGMGGSGKTTLAQMVFNDEAVKRHFDIKCWICVSHPFDIKKLWKNIANSTGKGKQYDDATNRDDVSHLLQDTFRGKKFILVLDDVWNENPADWYEFKTPFMDSREGSKILVTTRNDYTALIMVDRFQHYPLGILNKNDCWSLFKEIAFGSTAGAVETPKLVEIGKEIVKKCRGLPHGVTFLGQLMRSKKTEEEWKLIRDIEFLHKLYEGGNFEILTILKLNYDYLPSHLKLCFSYCCLFPKDWIIERETLIRLWLAEGFLIETPKENQMSMEEIGNDYFRSLLSSFFFRDEVKDEDGNIVTCKMHDLAHNIARSVVGKHECLIIENADDINYISEVTRRISLLVNLDDEEVLAEFLEAALKKAKNLRTFLVVNKQNIRFDIGIVFKENKRLRVLDFSGSEVASCSVGGFKNLRYLVVKGGLFQKGIGGLSFLQTLSEFNVGDKKLNKNGEGGIEELEGLNFLSGDLRINNLQNASETDACRANLEKKKSLSGLQLSWRWRWNTKLNNNHAAVLKGLRPHTNLRTLSIEGFEGSKLPRWIEDSSRLPKLVKLTLAGGIYKQLAGFGALPCLKVLHLSSVDVECIGDEFYYSTASVGRSSSSVGGGSVRGEIGRSPSSVRGGGGGGGGGESRSSTACGEAAAATTTAATTTATTTAATTTAAFPLLKSLILDNMLSLKEWKVPPAPSTTGATCFPSLEEISIWSCPLLTTITPTTTSFPSLKVLDLRDIDIHGSAAETLVTNNLNSLTSLRLDRISKLISLPHQGLIENNNTLQSLEIKCCYDFKGFFSSSSSSLQSLKFYDCPALRVFPDIRCLTSLRKLEIKDCKTSKSLQDELACLSSSSSSSLEHLEYVHILKTNIATAEEEVVFEWRKE